MQPYIGTFYSLEYVKRNVLKQSEEEIEDIDKEIGQEQDELAAMQGTEPGGAGGQQQGEPQ